ncbi:MAG TPA: ATP-binding protein [Caulobacteraceae bacterium]|jgi:signal transduction histidine kinase/ActR/RegA family two-component response regulator
MSQLLSLAEPVEPVLATTTGATVYQRFEREPDVLALAVVDAAGRPVGIIERNTFFVRMAAEYGRALYAQRPISLLMNTEPLVVEGHVALLVFTREVLAERPSELMQGFIVVDEGRYAGIGSALSLLQATSRANRDHALEMTKLADTLKAAEAQAQAALNAKSKFLAVMSHEIRTPLNGVLTVADILSRRLQQEELKPYVQTILDSGHTLLRLLTDALDFSRADAGHLELEQEPFCLSTLLRDVAGLWTAPAVEKALEFEITYEGPDDLWALGDEVRLKQVFNNLIGNALKFTDRGAVRVRLVAARDDLYVRMRATVADSGPGVDDERLPHIFQPFVQTDAGRAKGGTGLGLAICRELVERMDGAIRASHTPGGGLTVSFDTTAFHVACGQARSGRAEPDPIAADRSPGRPLHVLIADDNATNRMVAETLCSMFGYTSQSVADGVEAVDAMRLGAFDLVLMDIKMPLMDGQEAARRIRAMPGPAATAPIVALTANADPWDAAEYLEAGMDAVVEKPIKPAALLAAMTAAFEIRSANAHRAVA